MRIFYALLVLLTTVSAYGADKKFNVGTWTDDSFDDTPTYPGNAAYYNLQGIKVNNPVKGGIYILRDGSDCIKVRF